MHFCQVQLNLFNPSFAVTLSSLSCLSHAGSDVFSTSTDGQVMWWDIRKLVEPVETLSLEFAGYKPGVLLGGIALEYESTMVRQYDLDLGLSLKFK